MGGWISVERKKKKNCKEKERGEFCESNTDIAREGGEGGCDR